MKLQNGKKKEMRLLSMLLTFAMLLSGNGITAFAHTVSANEVEAEGNGQPPVSIVGETVGDQEKEEEKLQMGSVTGEIPKAETAEGVEEDVEEDVEAGVEGALSNPSYDSESDSTLWSYVYFGSYPQTQIKWNELTDEIKNAPYDANGDAWVKGAKYRRISGNFQGDGYCYFKWERIRWRVLEIKDDELLVMADMALDCQALHGGNNTGISWGDLDLRTWLNDTFYNSAFNKEEQAVIQSQEVEEGIRDNVYLPSCEDMRTEAYGFPDEEITGSRVIKKSGYATINGSAGNVYWLRTMYEFAGNVMGSMVVKSDGNIKGGSYPLTSMYVGVVPVLKLQYSSDVCFTEDDKTSGLGGEEKAIKSIYVSKGKTTYSVGEQLDLDDLSVAIYSPEEKVLTEEEYSTNADSIDMDTPGRSTLTVSYEDGEITKTADIIITVIQEGTPQNPVYHSVLETDFNYIYFGSYPQSRVYDNDTIAEIENAIAEAKEGENTENGTGIDVWVKGNKYRRISKNDTNSDKNLEGYTYYYFKWERIKWRVLQNEGDTLFLMADSILDSRAYRADGQSATWEQSDVRSWLNDSFYNTAFSEKEKEAVREQIVTDKYYGGTDTTDKIYLLSEEEMCKEIYGFPSVSNVSVIARQMRPCDYAAYMGNVRKYWVRPMGRAKASMTWINFDGVIWGGGSVDDWEMGVVPVLHIQLSSDTWFETNDSTSGDGGEEGHLTSIEALKTKTVYVQGEILNLDDLKVTAFFPESKVLLQDEYTTNKNEIDMSIPGKKKLIVSYRENDVTKKANIEITVVKKDTPENPVYDSVSGNTIYDFVYFGSYPQSEVTDPDTIAAIENAIRADSSSMSSDSMVETDRDVWVNGIKYRRISKDDTNDAYGYFKWERIKWRVLRNEGNTLFLMADSALDCKYYHDEEAVTWEGSFIRSWLNDSFYHTAFNNQEQGSIIVQNVSHKENQEYLVKGANDTSDKIYLLSLEEASDENYGFCADIQTASASRQMQSSDYALGKSGFSKEEGGKENCLWWLRSICDYSFWDDGYYPVVIYTDGTESECEGDYSGAGVVPVLHIDLDSDTWLTEDDDTSGSAGEESKLTSLQVTKGKTAYTQGETLNLDDLKVTACYIHPAYSDTETLSSKAYTTNVAAIDMNVPGNKTLTISYTEGNITVTADIAITVNAKAAANPEDNIQKNPVKVTKLTIQAPSKKLAAGKKVKMTLKVVPANAANKKVTWKSSNKKYATVDKNGKVTLKKAGIGKTVTITATATDGSEKKATIKIKIMKHAVKSIKLQAPAKTLKAGKSMKLKATVKTTGKSVNKTLKWQSSNTKYATVDKNGKVKAKKAGKGKTVTITATSTDGTNKKAKVKIKIK